MFQDLWFVISAVVPLHTVLAYPSILPFTIPLETFHFSFLNLKKTSSLSPLTHSNKTSLLLPGLTLIPIFLPKSSALSYPGVLGQSHIFGFSQDFRLLSLSLP